MWYPAVVTAPPDSDALVDILAHEHLRIDGSCDDSLLAEYVASAIDHVERYTSTYLAGQTVKIRSSDFSDLGRLPVAPVRGISSIAYVDTDGIDQTIPAENYEVRIDGLEASVVPAFVHQWPSTRHGTRITVTLIAGYETIPPAIRQAVRLLVGASYMTREDGAADARTAADNLLANFRFYP